MEIKTFNSSAKNGAGIGVHPSSHGSYNTIDEHCHEYVEMVYVVQGEGQHRIDGVDYDIRSGDFYVIHSGESHVYIMPEGASIDIINCIFLKERVEELFCKQHSDPSLANLSYLAPLFKSIAKFPRAMTLTAEQSSVILKVLEDMVLEAKLREPGFDMILFSKLTELLIKLSRIHRVWTGETSDQEEAASTSGHWLLAKRIRGYLELHYCSKVTLTSLSHRFNLSSRHIHRVLKLEMGKSVTELLHAIRIERAKQMLKETDLSIEDIATAVGFRDSSFFSRLFNRMLGQTPGGYRKQVKTRKIS